MLGQYSKIAEINLNVDITKTESGSYSGEWTVPISITFEPKFAFLYIMSNNSTSFTWDTRNHMIIRLASNPDIELSEFSITKKQMKFHKNARVTNEYTLKKVTVIG